MRISTAYLMNNLARNMASQLSRMDELSEQIATGKRVLKPSDDPVAASRGLAIRALQAGVAQYKSNVDDASDWLAATEDALTRANEALERSTEIALRASNEALSDDARKALAVEVDDIISEMVDIANVRHDERFIFAGLRTTTKPFVRVSDPADPGYPVAYVGLDGAKEIEVEPGTIMQVNMSGGDAFAKDIAAAGDRNVFEILTDLRQHLLAGAGSPTFRADIEADIAATQAAADELMNAVTMVGARARRLERVSASLSDKEIELEALLSKTEGADVAKAVTELQLQETVYRAALAAAATIMEASFVDYLG